MTPHDSQTRILVTGGTGFAGSHLIEALRKKGFDEIHTTSFSLRNNQIAELIGSERVHQVDLTNRIDTAHLLREIQPTQIYHLAAFADAGASFENASEVMHNNTALQLNILESMREHCPEARIVVIGSALQYGIVRANETPVREEQGFRPVNPYAVSKITQELLAYMYGVSHALDVVRVRSFNHIGERQTTAFVVPAFAEQIVKVERGLEANIKVGNLEAARDFSDVRDVVEAYILLMEQGKTGEVYNVGSGTPVTMQQILSMLVSMARVPVEVVVDPARFRPVDIPVMVADTTKINALGWKNNIPLAETLGRVLEWYRSKI